MGNDDIETLERRMAEAVAAEDFEAAASTPWMGS